MSTGNQQPTALHHNPFHLLGVTTRDNARRIVEMADEKALSLSPDLCSKARAELTNPRNRLASEVAWLPAVSPSRASTLVGGLGSRVAAVRQQQNLPILARANLLAAGFELLGADLAEDEWVAWILQLADDVEAIDPETVWRAVNEDRVVAGFAEVGSVSTVETELASRRAYYRESIVKAINRLPAAKLIDVVNKVVEVATSSGQQHAPLLIDEVVDAYEVETGSFLEREKDGITRLIDAARAAAPKGATVVDPIIDRLSTVVRNWDRVAQPIQLSAKARGTQHEASTVLAHLIRGFGIDLFNEHDMLESARKITTLLQDVFAEVPEVFEQIERDVSAIDDIAVSRERTAEEQREFAEEITFEADIGTIFKNKLRISPDGLEWKKARYPLDRITRVRWGAIKRSVNGIPTGTSYTIAFGDRESESVVELTTDHIFIKFTDKLWRSVGVRMFIDFLQDLRNGKEICIGNTILRDGSVDLVKRKVFGADQVVTCTWHEVLVSNGNGSFFIRSKSDKKAYAEFSYIETPNTHVIEHLIRTAFKKPMNKLSDAFLE